MESHVTILARALAAAARGHGPPAPLPRWWDDRLLAWLAGDPALQARLFRFTDVLPCLRSDRAVLAALEEWLGPLVPGRPWLGWLLASAERLPTGLTAWGVRQGAGRLAGRFIAGHDPAAVARTVAGLGRQGLTTTVDWLGETVLTAAESDAYLASYQRLLPVLATATRDRHLSIKLSALDPRPEPADPVGTSGRIRERLRPFLRAARDAGAVVNVDMEHHAYRDLVLHTFADLVQEPEFRTWPGLAIALQAYLRSIPDDIDRIADLAKRRGTPLGVRLVKGAYWDHETALAVQRSWVPPVWQGKGATDAAYEAAIHRLFHHRPWLRPAFASHHPRTLAAVIAARTEKGLAADACEFQLLHGMADGLKLSLVERGERVRVYCPAGEFLPGMAYLVRRLLENTANQGIMAVSLARGRVARIGEERSFQLPDPTEVPMPASRGFVNAPVADFADPAVREAIAAARWEFREAPPVIAGTARPLGAWLTVTDPSHRHTVLGRAGNADAALANEAMNVAASAFPGWRDTPALQRSRILDKAADLLLQRRWTFATDLVYEAGKSWREADAEVAEAIDFLRYYAAGARDLAAGRHVDVPGETNDTVWEPRGPTVVIAPWNFPLAILGGMAAAALAVGCPVILKPAEQASLVAGRLHGLLLEAGIPPEVCAYLPGQGEVVGPVLMAHPELAVVAFTGSRAVGELLRRQAAGPGHRYLVQVVAELGGKNAILVDASADLDEAVAGIVASAVGYQGQKCSACSRVIVHQDLHAPLRERLITALAAIPVTSAADPAHGLGPVIDRETRDRLHSFLALQGTPVWAGTIPPEFVDEGWYVAPHLFDHVDPDSSLAQDELFGPILALLPARDLDHALQLANGTKYALTGGAYARTPSILERVRRDFRVGNLYLNRGITGALVHRQPFGGGLLSGVGSKAGGPEYLRWFCWPRIVTENTLRHGMVGGRGTGLG